jgi:hypothetical protein
MRKRRSTGRVRDGSPPLARYTNYFQVKHNPYEFLVDFGQFQPETAEVVLHTRIAFGPTHAKLLNGTLESAVARFEAENGPIPQPADTTDPMEVVLRSLPAFGRSAADARASAGRAPALALARRPAQKR